MLVLKKQIAGRLQYHFPFFSYIAAATLIVCVASTLKLHLDPASTEPINQWIEPFRPRLPKYLLSCVIPPDEQLVPKFVLNQLALVVALVVLALLLKPTRRRLVLFLQSEKPAFYGPLFPYSRALGACGILFLLDLTGNYSGFICDKGSSTWNELVHLLFMDAYTAVIFGCLACWISFRNLPIRKT